MSYIPNKKIGYVDYNDAATASTPIVLVADTWTDVPNDKLGSFTDEDFLPPTVTNLMDGSTGYLDFSDLSMGSDILIRIDFLVSPDMNNSLMETRYVLGQGVNEYTLGVSSKRLDIGSGIFYSSDKGSFYIYMGDTLVLAFLSAYPELFPQLRPKTGLLWQRPCCSLVHP